MTELFALVPLASGGTRQKSLTIQEKRQRVVCTSAHGCGHNGDGTYWVFLVPKLRKLVMNFREEHQQGVRVLPYMDDFLIFTTSKVEALKAQELTKDLAEFYEGDTPHRLLSLRMGDKPEACSAQIDPSWSLLDEVAHKLLEECLSWLQAVKWRWPIDDAWYPGEVDDADEYDMTRGDEWDLALAGRCKSELGDSSLTELPVQMQGAALQNTTSGNYWPKAAAFMRYVATVYAHESALQPAHQAETELLWACTYVVFVFVTFRRPDTGVSMQRAHMTVSDDVISVVLHKEKGRQHVYLTKRRPPSRQQGWEAWAVGALLEKCCFLGGWSQLSSAIHAYINPTVVPDEHMERYFGWTTQRCKLQRVDYCSMKQAGAVAMAVADEAAYPRTILDNWDEVPQEIEQAQQSILDRARGVDPHVAVVRDIVEVHVYGPQCTDLTLIDLPGIVRFTGDKESKTLGEDIKALINDYLINERCVILAVVPANVDFHNSEIMADAKKVDPTTQRTMPVITKPDLIDKGAERSVRDLLLGRKHQCYMGFHMVKLRGQKNLNEGVSLQFRSSHLVFYIAQQTSISDKKQMRDFDARAMMAVAASEKAAAPNAIAAQNGDAELEAVFFDLTLRSGACLAPSAS
ncbi:hypothetical protein CYMTET_42715 [Cymbomonas tetramitiformis]|uniref:Dynamin GTPase domain-containing protein n=1 Tax=Cymbomonas tetramitiformis TaxID=36881 RepID=A0AAE0C5K0_9CHLO|nr:hypothetical protein CYMTET_42715 [Cymbomonas tetramitiformis]